MGKSVNRKPSKNNMESCSNNNNIVKVGDTVLMRPEDENTPSYVARIENIYTNNRNKINVKVRWFYRPEETRTGRRQFHGSKELFSSDHIDLQSADSIEGKCVVHSLKEYTKLDTIGDEDYYSRYKYQVSTGAFYPERVAVYCKCETPYNPDKFMVQCDTCKDWYHPACVNTTREAAELLDEFTCADCASSDTTMKSDRLSILAFIACSNKVEQKHQKR